MTLLLCFFLSSLFSGRVEERNAQRIFFNLTLHNIRDAQCRMYFCLHLIYNGIHIYPTFRLIRSSGERGASRFCFCDTRKAIHFLTKSSFQPMKWNAGADSTHCKVFKWELPEGEENEQNTCFCTALKMLKFYHLCSQIFYRFATKKITSLLQTLQFCYNFFGFWVLVCFPNPPEFPTHDKPNSILQSTWTLNASGVLKMKITSWDLSLMRYEPREI